MNRDPYTVDIQPNRNAVEASVKLAKYIIDRWMPGNAGGVHVIVTPQLARGLSPLYARATIERRVISIRITVPGQIPVITELR